MVFKILPYLRRIEIRQAFMHKLVHLLNAYCDMCVHMRTNVFNHICAFVDALCIAHRYMKLHDCACNYIMLCMVITILNDLWKQGIRTYTIGKPCPTHR